MPRLLVNIDHVATLRNARRETFPDPVEAALACEAAGADGVVFHLREDRRHITDDDVRRLKAAVSTKLDFELSMAEEIVQIALATRPHLVTLVPERREEVTTEGGLDVTAHADRLRALVPRFYDAGIEEVALFVDPVSDHIAAAAAVGANAVELHTGDYANARTDEARAAVLARLAAAAEQAHGLGLRVHAGHGLDYENLGAFFAAVPHVHEVSIGFALVARALFVGLPEAVGAMAALVHDAYGR
ncbi:MAG: pyridoxine 5'-phosphate synthase [Rhodothermales bacterium]|nr:pyridoxine 5'-phosphate synthase [Rhodothermales bacterium]